MKDSDVPTVVILVFGGKADSRLIKTRMSSRDMVHTPATGGIRPDLSSVVPSFPPF